MPRRREARRVADDASDLLGMMGGASDSPAPPRPSIPPLLVLGLSLWGTCAVVWPAARLVAESVLVPLALGFVVACIAAALTFWRFRRVASLFCLILGVLLGATLSLAQAQQLEARAQHLQDHPSGEATLYALEDASRSDFGYSCLMRIAYPDGASGRVLGYFNEEDPVPLYGEAFHATVDVAAPSEHSVDRAWEQGRAGTASLLELEQQERDGLVGVVVAVRSRAIEALAGGGDESAVLQALVCGYCVPYDESEAKLAFTLTGLAHVVAVSGAHLVIVASFAGALLRHLRVPRGVCLSIQALLMLSYLVLAGMPVSAVRAFAMALAAQGSYFARRRSAGLAALGACLTVLVALDPTVASSASFTLSALSSLGIALFGNLASCWIRAVFRSAPALVVDALALTLASSLLALPYSCALFSQLPLVSPLANVVVAPLVAPVCSCGIVIALLSVGFPMLGAPFIAVLTAGTHLLCVLVELCAKLPFACIPFYLPMPVAAVMCLVATMLLWRLWPRPPSKMRKAPLVLGAAAALTVVLGASALVPLLKPDALVMLDVGQGDALLVRSRGTAVLIDTGTNDSLLRAALARQGVRRLDAVAITHPDDDHCGSLGSLRGIVEVGSVLVARDALSCPCDSCEDLRTEADEVAEKGVVGLAPGDRISVGRIGLEAVWPDRFEDEGGNGDSLCLLLSADPDLDGTADATALLTGDAEAPELGQMLDTGRIGAVDVLKVGHHGSANALTSDVLAQIDPKIALVSVGAGNRYGHPAPETLQLLDQAEALVLRTNERGDVSCSFTAEGIRVGTLR